MNKPKILNVPKLGRIGLIHEKSGFGVAQGFMNLDTNLSVEVFDKDGNPKKAKDVMSRWGRFWGNINGNDTTIDLGSGLVTNVAVTALVNEAITLASPSGARVNSLFLANQHITGTGATAAAATNYKIQTISTNGGQTAVAGTQSVSTSSTMAVPIYKSVATITYTGAEAVTEWALLTNSTVSSTTGSPFTAATATTFTGTATPYTASSSTVQGLQQQIVEAGTTTVIGLVSSNTTSVGTLFNNGTTGWFTQAAQTAGSTPGNTETYTLRPILFDHKVFSAINVSNGDSIQFSYSLQINSGG
jgi:hypothetical protein